MPLNLLLRALPDLGYISAKHLYESGDIRQNPTNLAPVGTGPFKFVKYERGQYIIADRNADYWRPNAPYLDRIVWRVITDRAAAAAQMEAGELHYSPFSGLTISDMARLSKDKRFIVSTKGNEGNARTNTIEFNFRRKELSDIKVRRAIAHAINVPFFIDNFLGDFAKLGTGPIPSTSTDFYPGGNTPQYPYDKAKAALDKALRTNPAYATAFDNLGDVHARLASQAYDKALQIQPAKPAPAQLALVRTLTMPGAQSASLAVAPVAPAAPTVKPTSSTAAPSVKNARRIRDAGKPTVASSPTSLARCSTPSAVPRYTIDSAATSSRRLKPRNCRPRAVVPAAPVITSWPAARSSSTR